jgi:hypothetical protein
MTVRIDTHTARGPDALVQCGRPIDFDAMVADNPLIVVEVVSPTSERRDTDAKLVEYFSVPSIQHYLIVFPHKRVVVHHQRGAGRQIATRLLSSGVLELNPPGFVGSGRRDVNNSRRVRRSLLSRLRRWPFANEMLERGGSRMLHRTGTEFHGCPPPRRNATGEFCLHPGEPRLG